eukprot:jgi/Botrbrau1/19279/Bobra.0073s0026.2
MEDCCAVCAEPLEWTAYGPCGHKEACSKCVVRLRAVLNDQRCVICQAQHTAVIATKFMGTFTVIKPPEYFNTLKAQTKEGELLYLPAARIYFDDRDHFNETKKLCSFTHPVLCETKDGRKIDQPPKFATLQDLKKYLQQEMQLQFCDICLEGRKVFVAEQILYSKQELDRHQKSGDVTGPLSESSFKGHPLCKFCRKRFYGDNEMFTHMQHSHETCFLCRRSRPDKYLYYRDYSELEGHFRADHHLCEHPNCRDARFIVFAAEAELRHHNAMSHGGNMSRAEKRQALTIPIAVSYRRGERQAEEDAPPPAHPAFGVTIGGPGGGPDQRQPDGLALDASHFPAALGAPSLLAGSSGAPRYAAAAGASGTTMRPEDFPALAGTSRHAKKKEKERARSMAQLVNAGTVRQVLPPRRPDLMASQDPFPSLTHSASAPSLKQQSPLSALPVNRRAEAPAPSATASQPLAQQVTAPPPTNAPGLQRLTAATVVTGQPTARTLPSTSQGPKIPTSEEFPALPTLMTTPKRVGKQQMQNGSSGAGPSSTDNVSQGFKTANKELLDKVKARLDSDAFAAFRADAGAFYKGDLSAEDFHYHIVQAGLATLVPEIVSLLPDTKRQERLLHIHRTTFLEQGGCPSSRFVPPEAVAAALQHVGEKATWECRLCTLINGPNEDRCEACGANRDLSDEAGPSSAAVSVPATPAADAALLAADKGKGKKKKVSKFERLRLTGGNGDATQAWLDTVGGTRPPSKPLNAWTQEHSLSADANRSGRANASPGVWSKPGKLAGELRTIQSAWSKK